jgi:hypothetical protein
MVQVAEWMNEVVASADDDTAADRMRAEVHELMGRFPAPGCRTLSGETVSPHPPHQERVERDTGDRWRSETQKTPTSRAFLKWS